MSIMQRVFGGIALDARVGLRRLAASRASTAVAVAVLGLAIGAGTAVFSVVDAIALRRLPLGEPSRIMAVLENDAKDATPGGRTTPQTYLDWQRMQTSFDSLATTEELPLSIANEQGEGDVLRALAVTSQFFSVLGVRPCWAIRSLPAKSASVMIRARTSASGLP